MKNLYLSLAVVAMVAGVPAAAQTQLIRNGGFEDGTLAGWSTSIQPGSDGGFFAVANVADGTAPLSSLPYSQNPGGGGFFAMTDQQGSGSYALTQVFTLASAASVNFAFDLFANNYGALTGPGRDYTIDGAQNATVDILRGDAGAFTTDAADIVSVLYGPGADDPAALPNPFTSYAAARSLAAGTYQIRFANTHSLGFFNMGVDNVSVAVAAIPEASTWAMLVVGFGAMTAALRRRRRHVDALTA